MMYASFSEALGTLVPPLMVHPRRYRRSPFGETRAIAVYVCTACLGMAVASASAQEAGRPIDVVPFGAPMQWDQDGKDYGIMWEDARDVFRVVAVFADAGAVPDPKTVRLQYWQSSWPQKRIPRDQPSGAGSSGWLDIGDWFQGEWKAADAKLSVSGSAYTFTFNPVNAKEFPRLGDFAALYRSTLKLRLLGDARLPKIASFKAYTDSVWRPLAVEIEWGGTADEEQVWDGRLEAFNGIVQKVEPLSAGGAVGVASDNTWQSKVRGKTNGIRARILYAETKGHNSFDRTVVTVRATAETFSFAAADLLRAGHIFIPDFGVLVRRSGENVTYASADRARQSSTNKDLYSRVVDMPEQTLARAWDDVPTKAPHYIPLTFEGSRQHFGVDEHGNVFCIKNWISRLRGRDTDRCLWGYRIEYRFGLPDARPVSRHPVDGYLPMIVTAWEQDGVRYRQEAVVVPLDGVPPAGERVRADDPLVLMSRIRMSRIGEAEAVEARLDCSVVSAKKPEKLTLDGDRILSPVADGPKRLRMLVTSPDAADAYGLAARNGQVKYSARLTAEAPTRTVDIAIPYVTFTAPAEWERLRSIQFDDAFAAIRAYWRERIAASAQIETPQPMINDYYRAHAAHLLINTEREVGDSLRYMVKVGTFHYGVFANESCMMISDLDRRGYHERAEEALESWLHYQGSVGLPGDFSTTKGQLYGVAGYEAGGYNQHHGWVLWCLGEHYWYTRDAAWLRRVAPHIVEGCEWIIGERRRTIEAAQRTPIRAIERGLLPPGRLEDIGDWRSWLSTNVYSWWGMQNAAAALAAVDHPDGKRLLTEAEAYGKDVLASATEAMRRSPVVPLRDGTWIPHMPADAHRRGRSFGWITETLEGAIHVVRCGMIDPHDRRTTWIIRDFEDNLYLSEQFGYNLTGEAFDRYWFSRGGISMQANLLCNPIPYLLRDEPKHFLRAYFNAFAVSYFPDTRMMTEHALPNFGDWRGDHYKASDEANSTYWLRMMFVQERDDALWLGAAIPRGWLTDGRKIGIRNAATHFGPLSMQMESGVTAGEIRMTVDPPRRNPPARIRARFRHPEGRPMVRCEVNGKPHRAFDPKTEWVELSEWAGQTVIVAHYD